MTLKLTHHRGCTEALVDLLTVKVVARNHTVECLRFPGEGSSAQGKSGAKHRPNGVSDAQLVEIPVPLYVDKELKQRRRRIV